jgi:hypothetical protein
MTKKLDLVVDGRGMRVLKVALVVMYVLSVIGGFNSYLEKGWLNSWWNVPEIFVIPLIFGLIIYKVVALVRRRFFSRN